MTEAGLGADALERPSFLRGPLHDVGARLGLVRPAPGGTLWLGLGIGVLLWGALALLAAAEGILDRLFSLTVVAGHVRLLVAVPLLFAMEGVLELSLGRFVRGLVASEMVGGSAIASLRKACGRFNRLTGSGVAELGLLVLAIAPSVFAADLALLGATSAGAPGSDGLMVGYFYAYVCLPAFRFVLMRAVFRLVVWYVFLGQLSRMDLTLRPSHPDRVGGLRFLSEVQVSFIYMTAAASAILAAGIAEDVVASGSSLQSHYDTVLVGLLGCGALFLIPLLMFVPRLWNTRMLGLAEYGDLGALYAGAFDEKWIRGKSPRSELLGSADLQSLADLGNSVRIVEDMQITPITHDLVVQLAVAYVIPMLPLLLFKFPLEEIAGRVLEKLIGH